MYISISTAVSRAELGLACLLHQIGSPPTRSQTKEERSACLGKGKAWSRPSLALPLIWTEKLERPCLVLVPDWPVGQLCRIPKARKSAHCPFSPIISNAALHDAFYNSPSLSSSPNTTLSSCRQLAPSTARSSESIPSVSHLQPVGPLFKIPAPLSKTPLTRPLR